MSKKVQKISQEELYTLAQEEARRVNKLKDEYISAADDAARQANDTSRTIHGHLIVFSGTIISVSAVFINSTSSPKLGHHSQLLLATAWIVFLISIISGIYALDSGARFLKKWQTYNNKMAKLLGSGKYTTQTLKENNAPPSHNSSDIPGYIQYGTASLGVVMFLILMMHLLFKP